VSVGETLEFPFEPEFASLRESCAEIDRLLALPPDELRRPSPRVSSWSAEKQVAHVALANELVVRNLNSLIKGSGLFVVEGGEAAPQALAVLIAGRLPRGVAQAPRIVRPPEEIDSELVHEWVAGGRQGFDELSRRIAELRAANKKVPHQLMGPLSASQWLRFAAVHTRHHLAIAAEVLAASRGSEELSDGRR
jgi:hypothetical protein